MKTVLLPGSTRTTSRIGLGCGRLVGGADLKQSAKLVEAALDLGIRYFDVAPSYGLGTAEDVLGAVLGTQRKDITLASKAGISRPAGGGGLSIARKYLGPVLRRSKVLTSAALRLLRGTSTRGRFMPDDVKTSLDESLKRLKTDHLDILLLHDPLLSDMTDELIRFCEDLKTAGAVSCLGIGVNDPIPAQIDFGTVYQSRWSFDALAASKKSGVLYIHHGILRYSEQIIAGLVQVPGYSSELCANLGCDIADPRSHGALALGVALANADNEVTLVSFSDAVRMRTTITQALSLAEGLTAARSVK